MILILTYPEDPHFLAVESILQKRGVPYRTFWFDDFPDNSSIGIEVGSHNNQALLTIKGTTLDLTKVTSVWYRYAGAPFSSASQQTVKKYIESECQWFLDHLETHMPQAFWVSRPQQMKTSNNKIQQLRLASQLGFQVPHTVAGNDVKLAIEAFSRYPEIIVKALDNKTFNKKLNFFSKIRKAIHDVINRDYVNRYQHHSMLKQICAYHEKFYMYTKRLSYEEFKTQATSLAHCPVIVQNYIPKCLELRVTVVGNKVFACAIYSQEAENEETKVDWRQEIKTLRHESYILPPEVEAKCLAIVKHCKLEVGCIDLVLTPDNEYVFLEINSNGQWLWVEERTGLPIAEAIADLLITRQGVQEWQYPVEALTVV